MPDPSPIVVVEIDEDSRLRIRQTDGVRIGFIDRRVEEGVLVVLPEVNQAEEILEAIDKLKLISPKSDDQVKTATATIHRLHTRGVVVARGPLDA